MFFLKMLQTSVLIERSEENPTNVVRWYVGIIKFILFRPIAANQEQKALLVDIPNECATSPNARDYWDNSLVCENVYISLAMSTVW